MTSTDANDRWPCGCPKGFTPHGAGWSDCQFTAEQQTQMARQARINTYAEKLAPLFFVCVVSNLCGSAHKNLRRKP